MRPFLLITYSLTCVLVEHRPLRASGVSESCEAWAVSDLVRPTRKQKGKTVYSTFPPLENAAVHRPEGTMAHMIAGEIACERPDEREIRFRREAIAACASSWASYTAKQHWREEKASPCGRCIQKPRGKTV